MDPLIWVFVAEKHHRFDPSKSFTFQNLSKPLFVQYGTGGVQGFLGYDTVTVSEVSAAWTRLTFPCSCLPPPRDTPVPVGCAFGGTEDPLGPVCWMAQWVWNSHR